eukprot:306833-Chlamydomonas_euryale.AAC.2
MASTRCRRTRNFRVSAAIVHLPGGKGGLRVQAAEQVAGVWACTKCGASVQSCAQWCKQRPQWGADRTPQDGAGGRTRQVPPNACAPARWRARAQHCAAHAARAHAQLRPPPPRPAA